ncbi:MAG TPA: HAD-IA family hydrolase [Dehalococcoidia bacterium]|nr:HAD-IA family hydrolase [Dehalococcoidia bacterium]
MAPAVLVFDLDGTLWDSRIFYAKAISLVGGGELSRSMQCLMDGVPVARLLREARISPPMFVRLVGQATNDLRLYPGVQNILHLEKARNIPMGVVTNLPRWIAKPMLDATSLSEFFGTVVDWGRCRVSKPSPRPLLQALEDLNISPSRSVWYVGDSVADGKTARAAEVSFAWASYGYGPDTLAEADGILKSFSDVLAL